MNKRIEELYKVIADAQVEIEQIRSRCKHEGTHMGNYMWAPGHMNLELICNECGAVVIQMQEDKYHM